MKNEKIYNTKKDKRLRPTIYGGDGKKICHL